jgi:hypothetical protein
MPAVFYTSQGLFCGFGCLGVSCWALVPSCAYNLLSLTFESVARFHKIHAQILTTDSPALLQNDVNTTNFYAPAVYVWSNSMIQYTWICTSHVYTESFLTTHFAPADHLETTLALCTTKVHTDYRTYIYLGILRRISPLRPDSLPVCHRT